MDWTRTLPRHTALLGALLALLAACKKDGGAAVPYYGCGKVSGFHRTDLNGAHFGDSDTTDWNWRDQWCAKVDALFPWRPVQYTEAAPDSLVIACYPNPARLGHAFVIGFYHGGVTYADFRFDDAGVNLLAARDSVPGHAVYFDVNGLGISQPQLVRAYYRAFRADGTAFRGHGDVRIMP